MKKKQPHKLDVAKIKPDALRELVKQYRANSPKIVVGCIAVLIVEDGTIISDIKGLMPKRYDQILDDLKKQLDNLFQVKEKKNDTIEK